MAQVLISRLRRRWPGILAVAVGYLIVAKYSFQLAGNWVAEQIQVTETTYNCLKDTYDFDLRG
jgi:hypothetical protein